MAERADINAEIRSWDEAPYDEREDGSKLTKAKVVQGFSGDLQGEGTVEFLMCYAPDGSARFVGQQAVAGDLGGRSGRFVLHGQGTFDGSAARWALSVVPGSGAGELAGLTGEGTAVADGMTVALTLDYDFE